MPAHEYVVGGSWVWVGFLHVCQYAVCLHVMCASDAAVAVYELL